MYFRNMKLRMTKDIQPTTYQKYTRLCMQLENYLLMMRSKDLLKHMMRLEYMPVRVKERIASLVDTASPAQIMSANWIDTWSRMNSDTLSMQQFPIVGVR